MNKKGLTLTELLLVIVIIAIVTIIAIPGIMDALSESRKRGGESVEKLVLKNLELYNSDNEADLWCLEEEGFVDCSTINHTCIKVSIEELFQMNPDIDMGECLFRDEESLYVKRLEDGNYKYYADLICSKQLKDGTDGFAKNKIADNANSLNVEIYYQTPDFSSQLSDCTYPN